MSEPDKNSQLQVPETSELAKWSLGLGLITVLSIIGIFVTAGESLIGALITIPLAITFGIVGLFKISKSKGRLKGTGLAIGGIATHLAILVIIIYGCLSTRPIAFRTLCGTNLSSLGKAISFYAKEHNGEYPSPSRWCDLLADHMPATMFCCRARMAKGDKARCHYAMNPYCDPNSPADLVLLFETKGGWNQFGGPEILTTEDHNGEGCNILFNDGSVKFLETKELGELKWRAKETNSGGEGLSE